MPTKLVLFCTKEPPPMGLKQLMLNKCEFIKQGTSSLLILFFLQILWNSVRDLDSRLSPTHSTALCHSELMKNSCQCATSLMNRGEGAGNHNLPPFSTPPPPAQLKILTPSAIREHYGGLSPWLRHLF